jgi:hypothetical protein
MWRFFKDHQVTNEDEEFNRIEREATMRKEAVRATVTPREWVGLTDEEIDKAWRSVDYTVPWEQHRIDVARAIEAKLREKNS